MQQESKKKYYVYVLLDPRKKGNYKYGDYEFCLEPFYVGKGKGKRAKSHIYNAKNKLHKKQSYVLSVIKSLHNKNLSVQILYHSYYENEKDALLKETEMILIIGRRDLNKGPLTNLTNGGEGMSNPSEETREKLRKAACGKNNPMSGTWFYKKWVAIYGKEQADIMLASTKNLQSQKAQGKRISKKTKILMRESKIKNNSMKGKTHYFYWLKKYGKTIADEKLEKWKINKKNACINQKTKNIKSFDDTQKTTILKLYNEEKKSTRYIADVFNCSKTKISKFLKDNIHLRF